MTRPPPGVSFAQFFPNAPKVRAEAQGRTDRDKTRHINYDAEPSETNAVAQDVSVNAAPPPHANGAVSATQHHGDDDSPIGDMPSTVESTSSHASSSSSLFSNAATRVPTSVSSRLSSHMPATSSPLHHFNPTASYLQAPMPPIADVPHTNSKTVNGGISASHPRPSDTPRIERETARDAGPSVKGRKCIFDPILDRLRNKYASKSSKPVYKDFGVVCYNG